MPETSTNTHSNSKIWYLYMIRCSKGHLYTGITTDLARRLDEHQKGAKGAKYFRGKKDLTMVYHETLENRSLASKRELAIKKLSHQQKLKLIMQHSTSE